MIKEWGLAWLGACIVQALLLCALLSFHQPAPSSMAPPCIVEIVTLQTTSPPPVQEVAPQKKQSKPHVKQRLAMRKPTFSRVPVAVSGQSAPQNIITSPSHQGAHMHTPPPTYPIRARRLGLEGSTKVALHITRFGHVHQCHVTHSSGHTILDESVCKALHVWKISPARYNNLAIASAYNLTVRFSLTHGVHF